MKLNLWGNEIVQSQNQDDAISAMNSYVYNSIYETVIENIQKSFTRIFVEHGAPDNEETVSLAHDIAVHIADNDSLEIFM